MYATPFKPRTQNLTLVFPHCNLPRSSYYSFQSAIYYSFILFLPLQFAIHFRHGMGITFFKGDHFFHLHLKKVIHFYCSRTMGVTFFRDHFFFTTPACRNFILYFSLSTCFLYIILSSFSVCQWNYSALFIYYLFVLVVCLKISV